MVARPDPNSRQKPETLISENGESITVLLFPDQFEFIRRKAYEERSNLSEIVRHIVRAAMRSEEEK